MILNFNPTLRTARANQIIAALDAGAAAGTIKFYTGPKPAAGAAITTETLIGTCTLSDPCGTVTDGVLTFSTITDDLSADADGDIAWARAADSDGNWVFDGDCGLTGSGAVFIFNTLTARAGGILQILSAVLTEGNA